MKSVSIWPSNNSSPDANMNESTPAKAAGPGPSAVQRVVDLVLSRIRSGEYAPGQIIVAPDLMTELGVSKAPVREGIHVLVGEGVMELLPNRSARIKKLSAKDTVDFAEIWAVINGLNIRLAAAKLSRSEDRDRVRKALERIQATGRTRVPYDFFIAVGQLHSTLAEISQNSFALAFVRRVHLVHFYRHIERGFPGAYWDAHLLAFKRIGEALLENDGDRAERTYLKHMRWVAGLMRQSAAA